MVQGKSWRSKARVSGASLHQLHRKLKPCLMSDVCMFALLSVGACVCVTASVSDAVRHARTHAYLRLCTHEYLTCACTCLNVHGRRIQFQTNTGTGRFYPRTCVTTGMRVSVCRCRCKCVCTCLPVSAGGSHGDHWPASLRGTGEGRPLPVRFCPP